jgi:hypothetical protein
MVEHPLVHAPVHWGGGGGRGRQEVCKDTAALLSLLNVFYDLQVSCQLLLAAHAAALSALWTSHGRVTPPAPWLPAAVAPLQLLSPPPPGVDSLPLKWT